MIITGDSVDEFRKDFDKAMSALQEKYDITINLGIITYYSDRFSARLEVKNSRNAYQIASSDFDANVWKFEDIGFQKGMYMRVFVGEDGERYAAEALNVKSRKYPIEVIRLKDGEHYKLAKSFVKEILNEYYVENTALEGRT